MVGARNAEMTQALAQGARQVCEDEDEPMIRDCQTLMGIRPHSLPAAHCLKSIVGLVVGNNQSSPFYRLLSISIGGQGGIRTHGELAPTAVFKTAALNHSATCPMRGAASRFAATRQFPNRTWCDTMPQTG